MAYISQLSKVAKAKTTESLLKVLLYGKAGTGKTTSILSSCERPVLVIDAEKGSSVYGGAFDFDLFESLEPVDILNLTEEMLQLATQNQPLPWKTVVIDSGTVLYALIKQLALDKFRIENKSPSQMKLQLDEFAYPKELLYRIVNNLKKLPIHLFVTSHEATNYLPNAIMKPDPANPTRPDIEKRAEHEFDVIIHLERKGDKHKATVKKSRLITPDGKQVLPAVMDNIDNMTFAGELHRYARESKGFDVSVANGPKNVVRTNAKFESMLDEALQNCTALQWTSQQIGVVFRDTTGYDHPDQLRAAHNSEALVQTFLDTTRAELAKVGGGVAEGVEG